MKIMGSLPRDKSCKALSMTKHVEGNSPQAPSFIEMISLLDLGDSSGFSSDKEAMRQFTQSEPKMLR